MEHFKLSTEGLLDRSHLRTGADYHAHGARGLEFF